MSTDLPRPLLRLEYEEAAEAYLRSLPLEHFMEATPQATQRAISLASLELVKVHRSDFYLFNELLVQYPFGRHQKIHQVVPDNMVVCSDTPIQAEGSFDLPLQAVSPLWVMEYVSKNSKRKDYQDSFRKYERELKVPYYLIFYPDAQEMTLFHLQGKKYRAVPPNDEGRCPLPELEMEMAILDGWVRYWYQGELLPLPADLQRDLDETRRKLRQTQGRLRRTQHKLEEADARAEQAKAQAEQAQAHAEQAQAQAEQAQAQAEQAQAQAEQAKDQAEQAKDQAEQERREKERLLARFRALGIEPR